MNTSSNTTISDNTVYKNNWTGIVIANSLNDTIIDNTVYNNSGNGISLYSSVNDSMVKDNIINNNSAYGIFVSLSNNNKHKT